jgi:hypothetical protein
VLHCTVLYYTALRCTVLYCTVLYYTCAVLYCTTLHCAVLYYIVLYCTVLHCTTLHCAVLYVLCFNHVVETDAKLIQRKRETQEGRYCINERMLLTVVKISYEILFFHLSSSHSFFLSSLRSFLRSSALLSS